MDRIWPRREMRRRTPPYPGPVDVDRIRHLLIEDEPVKYEIRRRSDGWVVKAFWADGSWGNVYDAWLIMAVFPDQQTAMAVVDGFRAREKDLHGADRYDTIVLPA